MKTTSLYFLFSLITIGANAQRMPAPQPVPVSSVTKKQVIASLEKQLKANYIFADTAKNMSAYIEKQLKSGAYDTITVSLRLSHIDFSFR